MSESNLIDSFGRTHDYLRISLTDKCNFRCTYCMPSEHMKFMPDERLMSSDEIYKLAKIFAKLGVQKVRFTGGEPTLRKDLHDIVSKVGSLNLQSSITTNGLTLDQHLDAFAKNNLRKINISIDSIDAAKFAQITKGDVLKKVLANIGLAKSMAFDVKLNVVVIREFNDGDLVGLLEYASKIDVAIRFIEYMPFFGNEWEYKKVFNQKEMLREIGHHYAVEKITSHVNSTSENYFIPALKSSFGIIPTVSNPFCNGCSRIRLTADGKIKNCLFSKDENDLLGLLRAGLDVEDIIRQNILRKKHTAAGRIDFSHEKAKAEYSENSSMVSIGG